MKQGDIYEVYLDPTLGSEQSGRRPAVIFSGNLVNELVNTVIVCPLTSKLKRYKGNLIVEPTKENGLSKTSEVMTIHIRSISKERILKKYGKLTEAEFEQIVESLYKIIKF
ncbi:type II toxin-antitoxin system PemK/MazF family toxin [Marixanthomonas spongiae]|uniref:mRNA interferase n=1 Tax=Marixanthomonas spongiae TaxID=2174845 RepID=A0A2U0I886_9FLAO|nr:type II toxin-antitoxin system PemK/MazF family toxin [Marixanthomonas spongiae]PVW17298.1 transcription elongation factor GreAB [Marixanthomonas spongiae]